MQNRAAVARKRPNYPIASVDNALRLLALLAEGRQLRVSEAAHRLGTARSTAHRLLAMLEYHGFVRKDPASRAYEPGQRLVELALSAVGNFDVHRLARPHLERLCEAVGETVHLVTQQGPSVLFLDSVETTQALRVGARVGIVMPLHCTAGGKAILVQLSADELRTLYPGGTLEPMTPESTTSLEALLAELDEIRRRGYATNFGESEQGIGAVAVPVPGSAAEWRLAVTVSVPLSRLDSERVPAIAEVAGHAAAAIAEAPASSRGPAP